MDKSTFSGQVAIISGALGDIGRAIALEFAALGSDIALGDILPAAAAQKVLLSIRELGRKADYQQVDISDAAAVERWLAHAAATLGTPSLIIPNAATATAKSTFVLSPQEWEREININLNGAFYLAQAASKRLLAEQRAGRIVFIGSWAAERPHAHIPAYSVSKAGIRMLVRCLALDLAPQILVNEVAPGYVDAGLSGKIFAQQPDLKEKARLRVPAQRLINPQDVARQVVYLCHPANQHITGSTLTMDGGLSATGVS